MSVYSILCNQAFYCMLLWRDNRQSKDSLSNIDTSLPALHWLLYSTAILAWDRLSSRVETTHHDKPHMEEYSALIRLSYKTRLNEILGMIIQPMR